MPIITFFFSHFFLIKLILHNSTGIFKIRLIFINYDIAFSSQYNEQCNLCFYIGTEIRRYSQIHEKSFVH